MIKQVKNHQGNAKCTNSLTFRKLVTFLETAMTMMFHRSIIPQNEPVIICCYDAGELFMEIGLNFSN